MKALAGRRDKIAHYWFNKVPPLDFFQMVDGGVEFTDLAVARGYADAGTTVYRYRLGVENSGRQKLQTNPWQETPATVVPLLTDTGAYRPEVSATDKEHRFLAVELQVQRGEGWSASTIADFSRADAHIVAVDR